MLVTSRRELQVYGEVVHQLDPLPVFAEAAVLPRIHLGTARAIDSGFDLTDSSVPDVVGICDMLGGIPLALELIAPRLVTSAPEALLDELRETFDQAPGRPREPLEPAVTVQQTMRLSYDQLDERQQRVFRVLSIMYGQWSVDDVLPLLTTEFDELEAVALIEVLVANSLISSPPCPAGEVRFTVNPVLQHFGRSMLAAKGEHQTIADRHASRMVALAEEAEPELTGPNQQEWLTPLDALYDDFRHAHEHLRENGRRVDALRLATALWRYAYTRGHYRQPRRWIETSLGEISGRDALRARSLTNGDFVESGEIPAKMLPAVADLLAEANGDAETLVELLQDRNVEGLDAGVVDRLETWLLDKGSMTPATPLGHDEIRRRALREASGDLDVGSIGILDIDELLDYLPIL